MKERLKLILQIDTTNRQEVTLGLYGSKENIKTFQNEKQSENLLPLLNKFLSENHCQLSDLTAILVNIGPGSYTGTRIGVTVANTLAWSLDIPVFGFSLDNLDQIAVAAKNAPKGFDQIVLPLYSDKN